MRKNRSSLVPEGCFIPTSPRNEIGNFAAAFGKYGIYFPYAILLHEISLLILAKI